MPDLDSVFCDSMEEGDILLFLTNQCCTLVFCRSETNLPESPTSPLTS